MSRSQESSVYDAAKANSTADQATANQNQQKAQAGIASYEGQLAKFAADNPYADGGAYETDTNRAISDSVGAGDAAAREQLQSQALRTGQNMAGANATAEAIADQNERNASGQEASTAQDRLGKSAVYGNEVLGASAVPAQMESGLYGTALSGGNSALGTAGQAAQQPSFWDTLGSNFASQLGKTAAGGNISLTKGL